MRCPLCDHNLNITSHIKKYKTPKFYVEKYGDLDITTVEIRVSICSNEGCKYMHMAEYIDNLMRMLGGRGLYLSTLPALL